MGSGTPSIKSRNPRRKSLIASDAGDAAIRCRDTIEHVAVQPTSDVAPPFRGEVAVDKVGNRVVIMEQSRVVGVVVDHRQAELRMCIGAGFRYVADIKVGKESNWSARLTQL